MPLAAEADAPIAPRWFGRQRLDDEVGHCCACGLRAPVEVTASAEGTSAVHRCAEHSPAAGPCAVCGRDGRRVPSGRDDVDRYVCEAHQADLAHLEAVDGVPAPPARARPVLPWSYGGTSPPAPPAPPEPTVPPGTPGTPTAEGPAADVGRRPAGRPGRTGRLQFVDVPVASAGSEVGTEDAAVFGRLVARMRGGLDADEWAARRGHRLWAGRPLVVVADDPDAPDDLAAWAARVLELLRDRDQLAEVRRRLLPPEDIAAIEDEARRMAEDP